MVKTLLESEKIDVPDGIHIDIDGKKVTVSGPLGETKKDFFHAPVTIRRAENTVTVEAAWPNKKSAAIVKTVKSRINKMIVGVTEGFTYKLNVIFAHFPVSVKIQGERIIIENFSGERRPRTAKIVGNVKVEVGSDEVTVAGIDIDEVSQTAANIEQATRIKKKDPRVFLDGIYVYEKNEGI